MTRATEGGQAGYVIRVTGEELQLLRGDSRAVHLWCCLVRYANHSSMRCYPSLSTLARDLGVARRTVMRIVRRLVKLGLLDKESRMTVDGDPDSNEYVLRRIGLGGVVSRLTPPSDTADTTGSVTGVTGVVSPVSPKQDHRNKSIRARFARPTLEDVKAYCQQRGNHVDPEKFMAYYESNGWRVGRNPMKDWRAAVRTWERNGVERDGRAEGGNDRSHYTPY